MNEFVVNCGRGLKTEWRGSPTGSALVVLRKSRLCTGYSWKKDTAGLTTFPIRGSRLSRPSCTLRNRLSPLFPNIDSNVYGDFTIGPRGGCGDNNWWTQGPLIQRRNVSTYGTWKGFFADSFNCNMVEIRLMAVKLEDTPCHFGGWPS